MRNSLTKILNLAILATTLFAAPVAASSVPEAESPPIPNWDGTDARVRMEPQSFERHPR